MDPKQESDAPRCAHLRCKGMYVKGSDASPDAAFCGDTTNWWCDRTAYAIGPDGAWVHERVCGPGRECFLPRGVVPT